MDSVVSDRSCDDELLSAEPGFFTSGGRQSLIDELLYFSRYSRDASVMLLTAAPGLGRSVVLAELERQLNDDDAIVAKLSVASLLHRGVMDCLLEQLDPEAAIFGNTDDYLVRESIVSCCDEAAIDGRALVVVVDDVDRLVPELQAELLTLPLQGGLQLILSASEANIIMDLQSLQASSGGLQNLEISPFDSSASRGYILHRLSVLGGDVEWVGDRWMDKLVVAGEGSPRKIDTVIERVINPPAAVITDKYRFPVYHLLAIAVIVVGLLLLWLLPATPQPKTVSLSQESEVVSAGKGKRVASPSTKGVVANSKQVKLSNPASASKLSRNESRYSVDERFLLSQPSDHYVLQIMGLSSKQGVDTFSRELPRTLTPRLIETVLNGKPWYILVVGSYESRQRAEQVRSRLPSSLMVQKPWLRKISELQQQLRKRD